MLRAHLAPAPQRQPARYRRGGLRFAAGQQGQGEQGDGKVAAHAEFLVVVECRIGIPRINGPAPV